jgi:hypothetical protein
MLRPWALLFWIGIVALMLAFWYGHNGDFGRWR